MNVRIPVENGQVRRPLVVGVHRVEHSHVVAALVKQHWHDLQRLVVLVHQLFRVPAVELGRGVFIPAEKRRRAEIRLLAEGDVVCVLRKPG